MTRMAINRLFRRAIDRDGSDFKLASLVPIEVIRCKEQGRL